MALSHLDVQHIKAAKAAARAAGMFVAEKSGKFLVFRERRPKNVFAGEARTPGELRALVTKLTTVTPAEARP